MLAAAPPAARARSLQRLSRTSRLRIEERPDRRRNEELAVDDVLCERIFDELARQPRVVARDVAANGSPPQMRTETLRTALEAVRVGPSRPAGALSVRSLPADSAAGRRARRQARRRSAAATILRGGNADESSESSRQASVRVGLRPSRCVEGHAPAFGGRGETDLVVIESSLTRGGAVR